MIKIKVPSTGQIYLAEKAAAYKPGAEVLVEAEGIIEPAIILPDKFNLKQEKVKVNILRPFSEEDYLVKKNLKEEARRYLEEAGKKTFRHGLSLKILDAELSFDKKKLTFYFTAEGRVDFRSLVADMVGDFGKIIRLQQIGPRDEARLCGGYGKCGQELCCSRFFKNTTDISLEMMETQDVSVVKQNKMAGCCGKLMCCLTYEMKTQEVEKNINKAVK